MADDQLSAAEIQQLKEIASALPAGHPALNKVNLLLNSQPTQFEKDRPGGGTTEGGPLEHGGYKEPSMTTGAGDAALETAKKMIPADPTGGHPVLSKEFWLGEEGPSFHPSQSGLAEAGREAIAGWGRGGDTRAKLGEAVTSGLGSLVGVSGRAQAEHAARGESGKIIGETAVPAATALASYALPKVLPRIGNPLPRIADIANKNPAVARLILGSDRAAALREIATPTPKPIEAGIPTVDAEVAPFSGGTSTARPIGSAKLPPVGATRLPVIGTAARTPGPFEGMTPTLKPIGSAELPEVKQLEPIVRAPEEVYQRPIEPAPGAGKGAAPSEMHPDELAEIRKEAGKPEMTAEEAHRFRINKMASDAASKKPANDLGGMKRAGDVAEVPAAGPTKLPTLFQKETRPSPIKLENLVNQAAGVKPLKADVPLNEQLSPQPTKPGEVVDPVKAKYPDPAVRQMVRANGERVYEAAKGNPNLVKALHDLTRVELRQALVNAGEDMGQQTVSNSKFAGEGSIPREEAFNRLLDRGVTPEKILELAKKTQAGAPAAAAELMPKETPRVSNLGAQRVARDRASRIREARP